MREKVWIFLLCACVLVSTAACGKTAEPAEEPLTSAQTQTAAQEETASSFASQLAGTYHSRITMSETMGVDLYLRISEDGSFVFARDMQFLTQEKGAGTVTENAFEYTLVNGEAVDSGTRTASYTVDPDGSIRFTSPMWFGATEPKITADDGSVSYPVFAPYTEAQTASERETVPTQTTAQPQPTAVTTAKAATTTAKPLTTKPSTTVRTQTTKAQTTAATRTYGFTYAPKKLSTTKAAATTTTTTKPMTTTTTTKPAATATTTGSSGGSYTPVTPATTTVKTEDFQEGATYRGKTEKFVDAMNSTVHYDVSISFSGGQYTGTVQVRLTGGMEHSETQTYSGTYTRNGNTLSMTGDFSKGTISGNSIDLTGKLSSFASASDSVTVTR